MKHTKCSMLGKAGYGVQFSPLLRDYFACCGNRNFGMSGPGALLLFEKGPNESCPVVNNLPWADALYDVSWSKQEPEIVATCAGDGTIQIWNIFDQWEDPLSVLVAHFAEVYTVDWGEEESSHLILSASGDGAVNLWDAEKEVMLQSFDSHSGRIVYGAHWSARVPKMFASFSADHMMKLSDIRVPNEPRQSSFMHEEEVLCANFSTFSDYELATADTLGTVYLWDTRNTRKATYELYGHDEAVKKVKFSPFKKDIVASCGYDKITRFWNLGRNKADSYDFHTEFVFGLDFSPFVNNMVVDSGWDNCAIIYEDIVFDRM